MKVRVNEVLLSDITRGLKEGTPGHTAAVWVYRFVIPPIVALDKVAAYRIYLTSSYRSIAHQRVLHLAWLARGKTGLPAAKPGRSWHHYRPHPESGGTTWAIDLQAFDASGLVPVPMWMGEAEKVLAGKVKWNLLANERERLIHLQGCYGGGPKWNPCSVGKL